MTNILLVILIFIQILTLVVSIIKLDIKKEDSVKEEKTSNPTDDEIKAFLDQDQKNAQDAVDALRSIQNFMLGIDDKEVKVGRQD